jgi:hypothetical protein
MVLATLLALLLPAGAFGQSNEQLDSLLLQVPARLDSTAYLVLTASGQLAETESPEAALAKSIELGLVPQGSTGDSPVQAQSMSWLVMKALDLPGGVMYSLFPGPRYAYREMAWRKVISPVGGPSRLVNGDEVVRVLTQALNLKKGNQE